MSESGSRRARNSGQNSLVRLKYQMPRSGYEAALLALRTYETGWEDIKRSMIAFYVEILAVSRVTRTAMLTNDEKRRSMCRRPTPFLRDPQSGMPG
ncbi:hypothetical protein BM221_010781 [Beauveria bassiana]|uniref:Uncharacterized protein n=1 Tax=Beauveria bassiana TaxID=176275 RepID=A0A2N6N7W9_BEABA|nr:hypothetical protein BM221_010781 [Beauveria bassiana]